MICSSGKRSVVFNILIVEDWTVSCFATQSRWQIYRLNPGSNATFRCGDQRWLLIAVEESPDKISGLCSQSRVVGINGPYLLATPKQGTMRRASGAWIYSRKAD